MEWWGLLVSKAETVIFVRRAPYLAVATYFASWASNVSDYCGELTRWDTLTGELGEPCRPEAAALAFVGGGMLS